VKVQQRYKEEERRRRRMKLTHNFSFLLLLLLVHMSSKHILASKDSSSYVVYFGAHSHVGEITEDAMDRVKETHYDFLGSFTGSRERATDAIFYSYTKHINGFAAHLDHDLAYEISSKYTNITILSSSLFVLHKI
jgi:hypothetical protein